MLVRAHVFVSGKVQGVWFRGTTKDEADKLGLTGWVRNLPDGRVEAIFEGEKEKIEKAIQFCGKGPRGARVTAVEVSWESYTGEFKDFKTRYF